MDRFEHASNAERGFCICLNCRTRVPLQSWITSLEMNCPKCGAIMVHEGSPYHLYALEHGATFDGTSLVPSRWQRRARPGRRRTYAMDHGA